VLRLKNGETQVLAGLISDEERSSANRLPGLGDLPMLGRLFSSQRDNNSKTEIVLLITPRILRNLQRPASATWAEPAGSEASVGAEPLQIKRAEPRGLSMSSGGPGSGRPSGALPTPRVPAPAVPANDDAADLQAGQPGAANANVGTDPAAQAPGATPGAAPAAEPAPAATPSSVTLTPVAPFNAPGRQDGKAP
jgi:general secretion pathway protein D